ncbi:MAG TPA: hypothetical protein VNX21_00930 [Candidatus Thermoplasmatota archaeon]|nr:hypothetical protein [Candidatus Thermoplasmatota archaeon]
MDGMTTATTPTTAIPVKLHLQIRELDHDLQRARENLRAGKLHPEQYAKLAGILDARIEALEAEVAARVLHRAMGPAMRQRVIGAN